MQEGLLTEAFESLCLKGRDGEEADKEDVERVFPVHGKVRRGRERRGEERITATLRRSEALRVKARVRQWQNGYAARRQCAVGWQQD